MYFYSIVEAAIGLGTRQSLDGMPAAFYVHMGYPLEHWWVPKKETLAKRMAEISLASRRRFEKVKQAVDAKIHEIQSNIERKMQQLHRHFRKDNSVA